MLLIDNSDLIKSFMEFDPGHSYWSFMALIRKKDYKESEPVLKIKEKQEVLVKNWTVDSLEALENMLPDMLKVTEMFQCRLYMHLDRKSYLKTFRVLRDKINGLLDMSLGNSNNLYSGKAYNKLLLSSTADKLSSDLKYWLFDFDSKDSGKVELFEKYFKEANPIKVPTKNGYHFIMKRTFDAYKELKWLLNIYDDKKILTDQNGPIVNVKENAMVLVAMADIK